MVTKLVPLYLVHQDAVSKVFYTTYSAGCAVFSWLCCDVCVFTNRKYVFKSGADTKAAFWTEFVAFMLDGWLRWALMLD